MCSANPTRPHTVSGFTALTPQSQVVSTDSHGQCGAHTKRPDHRLGYVHCQYFPGARSLTKE